MNTSIKIFFFSWLIIGLSACADLVDEGIDIEYNESNAIFTIEPIGQENGAINETVSFKITANATTNIKSCIVQATNEGSNGSGFNVKTTEFDDPFIDHNFGTIQGNTQSFTVRYDYIIPEGINRSRLTFTLVDETGKVDAEVTVEVVPEINHFLERSIYAKDKLFYDAFAAVDGEVYANIKDNYSLFSAENVVVQKKLDFFFYYDSPEQTSVLGAPISPAANLILNINNSTSFKKLEGLSDLNIADVSPSQLIELTAESNLLQEGETSITDLRVGDVIGFITDLNADFSLKTGLIKVTGLHPSSIDRYEGISFVLECDIVVQK